MIEMNIYIYIVSVVVLTFHGCDGFCMAKLVELKDGRCFDNGTSYLIGESKIENCLRCTCSGIGHLGCCSVGISIVQYPPDCIKIKTKDGCGDVAVQKENEALPCMGNVAAIG